MVNDPEPVFKRLQDETNDGQPLAVLNDAARARPRPAPRGRQCPWPLTCEGRGAGGVRAFARMPRHSNVARACAPWRLGLSKRWGEALAKGAQA
jgi:hypothetical protein